MSQSSTLPPAVQANDPDDAWDLHPTIADEDIEAERQYWASERRRHAADPTEADIAWWFEQNRDDDQMPDALIDAMAGDALGQSRLDAGCLL